MHAAEVYGTAFSRGLHPESRLTVSEWADKYRLLSQRASAEPGVGERRDSVSTGDYGRALVLFAI
jgi:phage terminase large subunit GpA-like protein